MLTCVDGIGAVSTSSMLVSERVEAKVSVGEQLVGRNCCGAGTCTDGRGTCRQSSEIAALRLCLCPLPCLGTASVSKVARDMSASVAMSSRRETAMVGSSGGATNSNRKR